MLGRPAAAMPGRLAGWHPAGKGPDVSVTSTRSGEDRRRCARAAGPSTCFSLGHHAALKNASPSPRRAACAMARPAGLPRIYTARRDAENEHDQSGGVADEGVKKEVILRL